MSGCGLTTDAFAGLPYDIDCSECGHPSIGHGTGGCAVCNVESRMVAEITDRVDLLTAQVEVMHAHVENLIERVYELEGGDEAGEAEGGKSFIERLVDAQIDRRDAKLKEEREAELVARAHYEAKCNCGYGGSHDPGNRGCVLYSYGLNCRKCYKPIQIGQWRFGSRETGYEHMGDDCER